MEESDLERATKQIFYELATITLLPAAIIVFWVPIVYMNATEKPVQPNLMYLLTSYVAVQMVDNAALPEQISCKTFAVRFGTALAIMIMILGLARPWIFKTIMNMLQASNDALDVYTRKASHSDWSPEIRTYWGIVASFACLRSIEYLYVIIGRVAEHGFDEAFKSH